MNHAAASRELIRALRGRCSQAAMNRRLGYTSNVTHAWETGLRYPAATDLLRALEISGRPPLAVLKKLAPCAGRTHAELVASWLEGLRRDRSQAELARRLRVNRNTVARWLLGITEPRLPELLEYVEVTTQRVLDFIAAMVEPALVPSVARRARDLAVQRELAYRMPWTHAVLRALELESYRALPRHEQGFIARRTGITLEEEQQCLDALLNAKQIRRQKGRFRVARVLAVDTQEDPQKNALLKQHWARVAVERLGPSGVPPEGLCSYNLFAIPEGDLDEVRQAHLDYYARLRAIVARSRHPTRVVLATLTLVPLDGAS